MIQLVSSLACRRWLLYFGKLTEAEEAKWVTSSQIPPAEEMHNQILPTMIYAISAVVHSYVELSGSYLIDFYRTFEALP